MADSANNGGEVDERDGMVVNWRDLTEEDRLIIAELIAQQQQQPREEPEAAVEPSDDDESRAAAAVLDALFNDTSSKSDFEGFAPAEVEASMMPTVGARVDSSEDEMDENREGEGGLARMSPIQTLTKLLILAWMRTIFQMHTCRLRGCQYSMNVMDLSSMMQNPSFQIFTDLFPDEIMDLLVSAINRYFTLKMGQLGGRDNFNC